VKVKPLFNRSPHPEFELPEKLTDKGPGLSRLTSPTTIRHKFGLPGRPPAPRANGPATFTEGRAYGRPGSASPLT
jgi:hypothetical protein